MARQHVQVAIIGAGPAGLFLAHLLKRKGISCVVFEARSRKYIEGRVRAGVLEHGTAELLRELGAGARMDREGIEHDGVKFRFGGRDHHLDFPSHTNGRRIMVYGQQEVVTDLLDAWLDGGGDLHFSTPVTAIEGADTDTPAIVYEDADGTEQRLHCDFVAACDGFHGVGRRSVAQMRSFVVEPLQYGRLFLAGDAAHIVPATGAKGLNLAVSDVRVLAAGLADYYRTGSEAELLTYSERCLRKVWRAQHFSWWMTSLLHRFDDDVYGARLQVAELGYLLGSAAARTVLAENYTGWIDPDLGF